ncbi:hypothetical protein Hypma_006741 [Hypsizygus marmoreus]|uniref:Uncharacterized protein n=1 Tax=Hypsizygus marmoreus TaxID=39966 RepID=A0A369K152_HYPMA|nr:hypothetical protein Hypma_006741 [Hypsizygus marmoreus]
MRRASRISRHAEQVSDVTSDEGTWEDVSAEKDNSQILPSPPPSKTSFRVGSSPRKRKPLHRNTYAGTPPRKRPATPPIQKQPQPQPQPRPPRKIIVTEEIVDGALQGASFTIYYVFDVFSTAIKLLRRPLYFIVFLWLLALISSKISHTLRGAFAPLCYIPGLSGSSICRFGDQGAGQQRGRMPRWADYPKLIDVQSTTFEHLLDESVGGSGLSLEIKKAEMATADLVTLVRVSNLKSRDMLGDSLGEFVDDAKKTGRDLQRLSSKIGGAVDSIMAVNDYALHEIEAANVKAPTILNAYGLMPWAARRPATEVVARTFGEAMNVLSSSMQRLILEAEVNLANLDRLEERLSTLHDLVSREDSSISGARAEVLSDLWTKLGGNRRTLRGFDEHLGLLRNLGMYRKKALAHVVAALQSLQAMSSDMEDIRERVAAPELTGSKIPVEVHMKSIKNGLERLKEGRVRAKRLEEEAMRRVLGITDSESKV